jgi:hypothetical protein
MLTKTVKQQDRNVVTTYKVFGVTVYVLSVSVEIVHLGYAYK